MRAIARLLQFAGLVALPLAMVLQLAGAISVMRMLVLAVAGLCAFWIGRLVEGHAR
jgi:hypothetical protein